MASRRHASQRSAWAGATATAAACLFTLSTLPAAAQSQTDLSQTDLSQTDLARAYQTIASKTFVDLTHSFGPDTPVWSGFGQAKFSPAADPKTHEPYTIPKDGFRTTYYEMVGQYGTHVDPPAHFAKNGITMDKIPLKQMILPLVVLDDTPYLAKDPNHAFSIDDLKAWERRHGRVPKGAFAALRTDMYKDWDADPERFKRSPFPAWAF
jgi:kynurenine formamidase